jgi:hypothetical protein
MEFSMHALPGYLGNADGVTAAAAAVLYVEFFCLCFYEAHWC